jgi:hypothetical protein
MKTYLVVNGDKTILAVFNSCKKANTFIKAIGLEVWKEKWEIIKYNLNKPDKWLYKGEKI